MEKTDEQLNTEKGLTDEQLKEVLAKKILELEVEFTASGEKSSEGDGRTAADIKEELRKNGS